MALSLNIVNSGDVGDHRHASIRLEHTRGRRLINEHSCVRVQLIWAIVVIRFRLSLQDLRLQARLLFLDFSLFYHWCGQSDIGTFIDLENLITIHICHVFKLLTLLRISELLTYLWLLEQRGQRFPLYPLPFEVLSGWQIAIINYLNRWQYKRSVFIIHTHPSRAVHLSYHVAWTLWKIFLLFPGIILMETHLWWKGLSIISIMEMQCRSILLSIVFSIDIWPVLDFTQTEHCIRVGIDSTGTMIISIQVTVRQEATVLLVEVGSFRIFGRQIW